MIDNLSAEMRSPKAIYVLYLQTIRSYYFLVDRFLSLTFDMRTILLADLSFGEKNGKSLNCGEDGLGFAWKPCKREEYRSRPRKKGVFFATLWCRRRRKETGSEDSTYILHRMLRQCLEYQNYAFQTLTLCLSYITLYYVWRHIFKLLYTTYY